MSLRARGHAEAEGHLGPVAAEAAFSVMVGRLMEKVAGIDSKMDRLVAMIPTEVTFRGSGVYPASGNLLIAPEPGGPPAGTIWHVRRVSAAGGTGTGAPGGTATAFIGMKPATATQGDDGGSFVDNTSTALPVTAFYEDYELVVQHPNRLYYIITSGTASTVYTITGSAKQVRAGPWPPNYPQ